MLICAQPGFSASAEPSVGIPAHKAADMVHTIIDAGRTAYSTLIVDRLSQEIGLTASENWKDENRLLLPAQFLKLSSGMANAMGVGMRYRLASLTPINPQNSPQSETEKTGLLAVIQNPDRPFTWIVQKGDLWYYEAIYPDKAVSSSCVSCHNNHPKSLKKDFKQGDVMGGLVIDFPLGTRFQKTPSKTFQISPEVVTDYIQAVLEADRAVYSKHVVQRLKDRNIVDSRGDWEKSQALMLPAQFLMEVGRIAKHNDSGMHFSLISLWPINPQNSPANEFEKTALERVTIHPIRPYINQVHIDGKLHFQIIYPDRAVTTACIHCHNQHPDSPKRDFELNDVMGGIKVTIPLE